MKDNNVYLKHIIEAISRIEDYTKGVDNKKFISSNLIQAGVIREIEIIGEASKMLDDKFKDKHPSVPWKQIVGMRDKLIHGYFGVDIEAVWETIKRDIPALRAEVKKILG